MFARNLVVLASISITSLGVAAPNHPNAPTAAPEAAAPMYSWFLLIDLIDQLEQILYEPLAEAREIPGAPEQAQAESDSQAYVGTYDSDGVRSGLSETQIAAANGLLADLETLLDDEPGILPTNLDSDLRTAIADQQLDLSQ